MSFHRSRENVQRGSTRKAGFFFKTVDIGQLTQSPRFVAYFVARNSPTLETPRRSDVAKCCSGDTFTILHKNTATTHICIYSSQPKLGSRRDSCCIIFVNCCNGHSCHCYLAQPRYMPYMAMHSHLRAGLTRRFT